MLRSVRIRIEDDKKRSRTIREFRYKIKDFRSPLEKYEIFSRRDDQGKCVRIKDSLPEEFDAEASNYIWFLVGEASECVNAAIKRLEDERKVRNNMKKFLITIDTEGDNLWQWKDGDPIGTDNTKYTKISKTL